MEVRVFAGPLIIGAGLAGLALALRLERPVMILTGATGRPTVYGPDHGPDHGPVSGGSSAWAQGGIAAAIGPDDAPALHAKDTMEAGAGLGDPHAVDWLANAAPRQIEWLEHCGVVFDRDAAGGYALAREAAHSRRRVLHAGGDQTGARLMAALIARAAAASHITREKGAKAIALLPNEDGGCGGVLLARRTATGEERCEAWLAPAVILATGGMGQLYAHTTNPPDVAGEGLALAAEIGAAFADLEFVQFHPTALKAGQDPHPLLTEALRGEGATLINAAGERFMLTEDPRAELAPRDRVARAIARVNQTGQAYLDVRAVRKGDFAQHFPGVAQAILAAGLDPARDPLPITPAAHYHMGGVKVDLMGRSTIGGLYACGEVAATGVHGANRLASNSLLEGLVAAEAIAGHLNARGEDANFLFKQAAASIRLPNSAAPIAMTKADQEREQGLRHVMMQKVELERNAAGLAEAAEQLHGLAAAAESRTFALRVLAARLITAAAQRRKGSIGAHYRRDDQETKRVPLPPITARELLPDFVTNSLEPPRAAE